MARIRTVKPSLWADEKLAVCSLEARLTFIGLLTESDDQGRQIWSVVRITGAIFPLDTFTRRQVSRWIQELADAGVIHFYENGRDFICIPKFREHQVVNRPTRSTLPKCPIHGDLAPEPGSDSRSPHGASSESLTEPSLPEVEVGSRNMEKEVEVKEPDESGPEDQPPVALSDWLKERGLA